MTERRGFLVAAVAAVIGEQEPSHLELAIVAGSTEYDAAAQRELDRRCLAGININPEARVKVVRGPEAVRLEVGTWRAFLVKVHNEAGVTAGLNVSFADGVPHGLEVRMAGRSPSVAALSGSVLDYRLVALRASEVGVREATIVFDVGQGTQDLGFRSEVVVLAHVHI